MTQKRRHRIFFSGRVQGVGYRRFVKRQADRLGLRGWVKNLPDRRVEAVAEGDQVNLDILVNRCWDGPALAMVRGVDIHEEPYTGEFSDFKIRY